MAKTIRVDDDVFAWLQQHARPFQDTPNSALRRVAGLDQFDFEVAPIPAATQSPNKPDGEKAAAHDGGHSMGINKFDEFDRQRTITAVEQHFGTKLKRHGSRRKSLVGEDSSRYWVLGGYEDWHGVPPDMVEDAASATVKGRLIIAKKLRDAIEVYSGDLQTLVDGIEKCALNKYGDRQFNLSWRGKNPSIKEVPKLRLEHIARVAYSNDQKESDKRIASASKLFESLNPEQRQELLVQLKAE